MIINILFYIKNIFYNPAYLQDKESLNPGCGRLFNENYNQFKDEISILCEKSIEEINKKENEKNLTNSKEVNNNSRLFFDKLSQENKNENLSNNEKVQEMKKWFIQNYVDKVKSDFLIN